MDSHCAMAQRPRLFTRSAYSSTEPSGNLKRFCTREVSSRMRRPFSPSTSRARVARMIISVLSGELEALLHEGGELTDAAALLTEHVTGAGGADDNLGLERGHADLDTGVAISRKLTGEELVELGVEDAVGHELTLLGALLSG